MFMTDDLTTERSALAGVAMSVPLCASRVTVVDKCKERHPSYLPTRINEHF